jgi:hypothetical protein
MQMRSLVFLRSQGTNKWKKGANASSGQAEARVLNNHRSAQLLGLRNYPESRSPPGDGATESLIQILFRGGTTMNTR